MTKEQKEEQTEVKIAEAPVLAVEMGETSTLVTIKLPVVGVLPSKINVISWWE